MNHRAMGLVRIGLGLLILAAGLFRWRLPIFTRQEWRVGREQGEDAVYARRKLAGVTGIALGLIVMLLGNF